MSILFNILMNFLVREFGKPFLHATFKILITLAFIAFLVSAVYAYVSTYSLIVNGIAENIPEIVNGVWGWVMPPNSNVCFFAIFSCFMLRFITRQYFNLLNWRFRASISN
jgi:hypothetical protein